MAGVWHRKSEGEAQVATRGLHDTGNRDRKQDKATHRNYPTSIKRYRYIETKTEEKRGKLKATLRHVITQQNQ